MPGDALFGPFTPPFWAALALGGFLGMFAARVRAVGTPFEGRPVATLLGVTAGAVAGAVVFLVVVAFISLLYLAGARTSPLTVFALTSLSELLLFGLYVMRRR
ncbi:MAG: hypothetical protein PVF27_08425 [Gemmatimonadales bacterium]|jgi:hypothetical protein